MRYLACIRLLSFYFSVLAEEGRPAILHRDRKVLEASPLARQAGASVGMPLSEAQALLENGHFMAYDPERFEAAQTKWLEMVADLSHVIEPLDLHVALVDLSELPRPEALLHRLRQRLMKAGWEPQIGTAPARWLAELAARHDTDATYDPARFVAERSIDDMLAIMPETRQRLRFLGCRTIGDVAMVGRDTLVEQFGDEGLVAARAAQGQGDATVQALYPPCAHATRVSLEGPVDNSEMLHAATKDLAQKMGQWLSDRDLGGKEIQLWLEHEEGLPSVRRRTFARSVSSPGSLLPALALMLQSPPERPVVGLRARLTNLVPVRRVQRTLEGRHSREMRQESLRTAMEHVQAAFGDRVIVPASRMPIPRRVQVLRAWKDATGWY